MSFAQSRGDLVHRDGRSPAGESASKKSFKACDPAMLSFAYGTLLYLFIFRCTYMVQVFVHLLCVCTSDGALVGPPGPLRAGPLWAPLGPCALAPPCALMGWVLGGQALMGRALVGPMRPHGPGPNGPPGPLMQHSAKSLGNFPSHIPFRSYQ